MIEHAPAMPAARSVRDPAVGAGREGLESMMWLAMRGALPRDARAMISAHHPMGVTGLGLTLLVPE